MPHPDDQPGPLSVYRAFVVQFDTHTDVERGHLAGRVEHVVSGRPCSFTPWRPCWRSWRSCCTRGTDMAATAKRERVHAQDSRAGPWILIQMALLHSMTEEH